MTASLNGLPAIKCSSCGANVNIAAMGEHVCLEPSSPPSPKSVVNSSKSPANRFRSGRLGPPPRIDPAAANRSFLSPPTPELPNLNPRSPAFPSVRSRSVPRPDVVVQDPSPRLPPPRKPDEENLTAKRHQREFSIDSKSSYRTSAASSHYDSRRSTAVSSSSRFLDDAPPLPSSVAVPSLERERYGGFGFSASDSNTSNYRDKIERSGSNHSDLTEDRGPPPARQPPSHLHPPGQEPSHNEDGNMRKNSDANSDSGISVSSFARALGLHAGSTADSSAASVFSRSESRSGTSLSSIPSEASFSRRKPSGGSRLGLVVEEHRPQSAGVLGEEERIRESPIDLEPPRVPAHLFSPDSPTDPAIFQGSLSLIHNRPKVPEPLPSRKMPPRSATAPPSRPRPKGRCRGCGEMITGKSVSSADGQLTGRYHRACFVCYHCRVPFQTADFYVLDDRPYCAQHYHELNGSLCTTCHTGIEGQYLETVERQGHGGADCQKFHPDCLRCQACRVLLKGDYFEWNGQVFCERDAFRAAWAPPSPRRPSRPTLPSPLSQSHNYPPPSPDGRGLRPGPRRNPERRTTRMMMI